ncbi:unnamed protein product [Leuciscus chuanchicus]
MEVCEESEGARTAAQRRAEIRRRKLMQNSEDRMKKIVGFSQSEDSSADRSRSVLEPRFHLDLERHEPWSGSGSAKRLSPHPAESDRSASEAAGEEDSSRELPSSPRRGLRKYLSRLDDAMKLRGHLAGEKPAPDRTGTQPEELDPFCLFRLAASVALALFVRIFVCQYLSIFAPFLTLELGFMGLHKYFPKVGYYSRGFPWSDPQVGYYSRGFPWSDPQVGYYSRGFPWSDPQVGYYSRGCTGLTPRWVTIVEVSPGLTPRWVTIVEVSPGLTPRYYYSRGCSGLTPKCVTIVEVSPGLTPRCVTIVDVSPGLTPRCVTIVEVSPGLTPRCVTIVEVSPGLTPRCVAIVEVSPDLTPRCVTIVEVSPGLTPRCVAIVEVSPDLTPRCVTIVEVSPGLTPRWVTIVEVSPGLTPRCVTIVEVSPGLTPRWVTIVEVSPGLTPRWVTIVEVSPGLTPRCVTVVEVALVGYYSRGCTGLTPRWVTIVEVALVCYYSRGFPWSDPQVGYYSRGFPWSDPQVGYYSRGCTGLTPRWVTIVEVSPGLTPRWVTIVEVSPGLTPRWVTIVEIFPWSDPQVGYYSRGFPLSDPQVGYYSRGFTGLTLRCVTIVKFPCSDPQVGYYSRGCTGLTPRWVPIVEVALVEKKSQATVLTAALLLSGIPSELISRSMDTYRKMSLVFSDLCVYFFSFVMCHELLLLCETHVFCKPELHPSRLLSFVFISSSFPQLVEFLGCSPRSKKKEKESSLITDHIHTSCRIVVDLPYEETAGSIMATVKEPESPGGKGRWLVGRDDGENDSSLPPEGKRRRNLSVKQVHVDSSKSNVCVCMARVIQEPPQRFVPPPQSNITNQTNHCF